MDDGIDELRITAHHGVDIGDVDIAEPNQFSNEENFVGGNDSLLTVVDPTILDILTGVHNGDPRNLRGGTFVGPAVDQRIRVGVEITDEPQWVENEHNNQRHAKAYLAGKLAHHQGYAAGSNPHAMNTHCMIEAMGWVSGWMDAMNEAINAVTVPSAPGRRAIRIA